jgi:hypothetical protein
MLNRYFTQLYIPSGQRVTVDENHINMIKFASAADETYQTVVRYLKAWVDSISELHSK